MIQAAASAPGFMAGLLVRTTVVLALALIAALAARRRPAAFRHVLLSSALIGLLVLPLLTLAPVGWRSPLLPRWMTVPSAGPDGVTAAAGSLAAVTWEPKNSELGATPIELTFIPAGAPASASGLKVSTPHESAPPAADNDSSTALGPVEKNHGLPLGPILSILWLAGAVALLVRLAVGLRGAVRLTAESTPLDHPAWRVLLERFLALVSLRRRVRLRSHPQVLVPLTWGWRKPVVLLPEGADDWSDDERSSALCHELSHIKRADFLVMLLVRASLALFWWNPLCWIAYRELLKEQEIACDDLVLRAGIRPSTYAATLLAFRRSAGLRWDPSAALLGLLGRSSFQDRLAAILRQKLTFMEVKMKTKILLALALVVAVAIIGTARPASGREIAETRTTLGSAALPPANPVGPVLESQTAAAATAQEKEKEKAVVEKKIIIKPVVIDTKGQAAGPVEIVITEGDQVKTIKLDKPVTITKDKDGKALVLSVDGKQIQVLKGEPLRLEIKGGELMAIVEDKPVVIDEHVKIVPDHEARTFVVEGKPGAEAKTYTIVTRGEAGENKEFEIVTAGGGVEKGAVWTIKEGEKGQAVWVTKSDEGEPLAMTWTAKPGAHVMTTMSDQEMLDKIHGLQEQVQAIKAKKMDLAALEQSLKKMEEELQANEKKLKELQFKWQSAPGTYVIAGKPAEGAPLGPITVEGKPLKADEATVMIQFPEKGKGTINIIMTGPKGDEGKKVYESALARLKKELPEGYKLEGRGFDAATGAMTFGVVIPEGQEPDKTLVKKLVSALESEIKK